MDERIKDLTTKVIQEILERREVGGFLRTDEILILQNAVIIDQLIELDRKVFSLEFNVARIRNPNMDFL